LGDVFSLFILDPDLFDANPESLRMALQTDHAAYRPTMGVLLWIGGLRDKG
jgi:hypothetical protein